MARNAKNTRMCTFCRKRSDRSEFVRIRKNKDGNIFVESNDAFSDGRGVYICPVQKCLNGAIKKNSISRSLKCEIPPYIYEELQNFVKTSDPE